MASLPYRQHEDSKTQQVIEPIRRELARITREMSGVRNSVSARIDQLASSTSGALAFKHVGDTDLADATTVTIQHGLGSRFRGWLLADLRGATTSGRIERILGGDETKEIQLQANGYGSTVTVRVLVY